MCKLAEPQHRVLLMYSYFKYILVVAKDKEPLHNKSLVALYHFCPITCEFLKKCVTNPRNIDNRYQLIYDVLVISINFNK